MRILMVAHNCVLESNQEKLVELAMHDDMELTLLTPAYNLEPMGWVGIEKRYDPRYEIIVAHSIWPWIIKQRYLQFYPALPWIIKRAQPDLIDLWEEPWSLVSYLTIKAARRWAPQARIIHETEQNISKNYPFPFNRFERFVLSEADHFIARNDEGVKVLREKGFEGPVDVIPNALSCEAYKPMNVAALRRRLGLRHFTVGFIGRIEEEKGLLVLFEALAAIPHTFQVLIVGQGRLRPRLQALAREHGFSGRCVFVDAVPQSETPAYINCMDAMILPSLTTRTWKEQFGRTLIEAMACGVPVIGSDSGAIPSVIGDAGIVVPEGDIEALREALGCVMRDRRLCRKMSKLGTRRLMDRFQWSVVARDMRIIYRRALGLDPYPEAPATDPPLTAGIDFRDPVPLPDEPDAEPALLDPDPLPDPEPPGGLGDDETLVRFPTDPRDPDPEPEDNR